MSVLEIIYINQESGADRSFKKLKNKLTRGNKVRAHRSVC